MYYYTDEFLSAKQGSFEKKDFDSVLDDSIGTEVCEVLNSFGVKGQLVGMETGPYITIVYFRLALGVPYNSIEQRSNELKMHLGRDRIKIRIAPEKNAVAIEIPNQVRITIPFGNVFHSAHNGMILPAALGVDPRGNPIYLDIASTPHLLIAGQTGGGKSVCLNSIIMSLALNCRPTSLQFLLIDPKGNEFIQYKNLSNLISGGVIDDIETALSALKWLVQEMECRYKILKQCGCQNIDTYIHKRNHGLFKNNGTLCSDDMPRIVVVIDEYADLMMRSSHDLQDCIKSLGQKARAIGIHLILATQRPSTKIIDGDIKSNLPTRIALKVASIIDSRTILDYSDAEKLLGKGDMLLSQGGGNPQRIHGCYISDDDIDYALTLLPTKKLYQINENDVFDKDIHSYCKSNDAVTWGEANAVCSIILDHFGDFLNNNLNDIRQLCVQQYGINVSKINIIFSDIHNALNETVIYHTIMHFCQSDSTDNIPPFLKAVAYSSHLRYTLKSNGHFLFIRFILKQAFENDDSAAMESVRSFYNTKTYHLDYIKGEIVHLCENGNVKAKGYLEEIRNKIVKELEYDCEDIDAYPNKESFNSLLAEAYPQLMDFLIGNDYLTPVINAAEAGSVLCKKAIYENKYNINFYDYLITKAQDDEEIKEIVCNLALNEESWKANLFDSASYFSEDCATQIIMRMAEKGDKDALDYFMDRDPNDYYHNDSLRNRILQLARKDVARAIDEICYCPMHFELDITFYSLTEQGQKVAIDYICDYFEGDSNDSLYHNEIYDDVIIKSAQNGNERAIQCICDNYEYFEDKLCLDDINVLSPLAKKLAVQTNFFKDEGCNLDLIVFLAKDNSDEAKSLTYDETKTYIIKRAKNGDSFAWDVIEDNLDIDAFYDFVWKNRSSIKNAQNIVFKNLEYYPFREYILTEAQKGNECALDCIYENLDEDAFKDFILNNAEEGCCKAQKVVYAHPKIEDFQQFILREAEIGDDDATDSICNQPHEEAFQDFILERACAGEKNAKKAIYECTKKAAFSHSCPDSYQDFIIKEASHDSDAEDIILKKFPIFHRFEPYIVKQAENENARAKEIIYNNPQIDSFKKFTLDRVLKNDENAKLAIIKQFDKYAKIADDLLKENNNNFINIVKEAADNKNKQAFSLILKYYKKTEYQEYIIDCAQSNITETWKSEARRFIFTNHQVIAFNDFILALARAKDKEAINLISNYQKTKNDAFSIRIRNRSF